MDMQSSYGKYVVYVDESGDHVLHSNDEAYPIFVLAFCVFHKEHYSQRVVPAIESFKFKHFGHDQIVLHENEIRKEKGEFKGFANRQEKDDFLNELTEIVKEHNFILISCVIDKLALLDSAGPESNLYHLALASCIESLFQFLREKEEEDKTTHVIVEQRGRKEDEELELEFRRICDGQNRFRRHLPFEIRFADKKAMSTGLQLADLVARPVGLSYLRPEQPNRAFEVLREKFYCDGGRENVGRDYLGVGLRIFPVPKSEKPR